MEIIISNSSDKPIYEQICLQIKSLIMDGSLSSGEALPSMRALAKDLHGARNVRALSVRFGDFDDSGHLHDGIFLRAERGA